MKGKVDKGRSDYGPSGKNPIHTSSKLGDKGIPPKTPGVGDPKGKTIETPAEKGNKGVPPMNVRPTAKPTLD